jgi:protoporphyrinogen oxidase
MARTTVGIIGGGPAGLALAYHLNASGMDVTLFEAAPELGGLARSFRLGDVTIERYYHFICGCDHGYFELLDDLGIPDTLRWRYTKMGYFFDGRLYPFSSSVDLLRFRGIGLLGRLRYGLTALYCSLIRDWHRLDAKRAEPWLISLLGEEAYMATWHPLLSVKFPDAHHDLSAAWVWHRVHRVASSRKTLFHKERLGYLEGGTQTLIDALERRLEEGGVELHTEAPIRRILTEGNRAVGVETAGGETHAFDYVVSTVPLPIFLRMAPHDLHPEYFGRLSTIEAIGVVCVTLRLSRPLTENFWTNVNDPRIPFNGCIEYTNLNPTITGDGSSIVYVPYYLPRSHERFSYSDERLLEESLESLALIAPDLRREEVLDYAVSRDPFAQIICPAGFAEVVPGHETPIDRLFLIESSQLYPSDRNIGGTVELAHAVAELIRGDVAPPAEPRTPTDGGAPR